MYVETMLKKEEKKEIKRDKKNTVGAKQADCAVCTCCSKIVCSTLNLVYYCPNLSQ